MKHLLVVALGGLVVYSFYRHNQVQSGPSSKSVQLLSNRTMGGASVTLNETASIGSTQVSASGGPGAGAGIVDPLFHNGQAGSPRTFPPMAIPANRVTGRSFQPSTYTPPSGIASDWASFRSLA